MGAVRLPTRSGGRFGTEGFEERPCPPVDVMGEDLATQGAHPASALSGVERNGCQQRVLHPVQIMRVNQKCAAQLGCGTGELGQNECSTEIMSARHVLL